MAIKLTKEQILAKYPGHTMCVVSYMKQRERVKQPLSRVNWKARPQAMTVLFNRKKFYMVDGDEAIRDGFRVVVIE